MNFPGPKRITWAIGKLLQSSLGHALSRHMSGSVTYVIVEGIAVKIPRAEQLDPVTLGLGPGVAVGQGGEEHEHRDGEG